MNTYPKVVAVEARGRGAPKKTRGLRSRIGYERAPAAPKLLTRAIILAAGLGSRLESGGNVPKPLRRVSGVPMLVTILKTLASQGVREAVVVVGHRGDEIRAALREYDAELGLATRFVENTAYTRSNGLSLVSAEKWVDEECLLSMADHLVAPALIRAVQEWAPPSGESALAVDRDIAGCFDIDDATKVLTHGSRIADLGKALTVFDAIDTGIFRIQPELVAELSRLAQTSGDCSLSDGVRALAKRSRFLACDVTGAAWIDVDTPEAMARAEAMGPL